MQDCALLASWSRWELQTRRWPRVPGSPVWARWAPALMGPRGASLLPDDASDPRRPHLVPSLWVPAAPPPGTLFLPTFPPANISCRISALALSSVPVRLCHVVSPSTHSSPSHCTQAPWAEPSGFMAPSVCHHDTEVTAEARGTQVRSPAPLFCWGSESLTRSPQRAPESLSQVGLPGCGQPGAGQRVPTMPHCPRFEGRGSVQREGQVSDWCFGS